MTTHAKRALALVGVTIALVLAIASPAFAHATLLTTEPQPQGTYDTSPKAIDLRFNEPVEVSLGDIRVFDGRAQRIVTGAPEHPNGNGNEVRVAIPKLDDGTFVVTWRVISADTHPVEGAFTFQVGATATVKNANGLAARLLSNQKGSTAVGAVYAVDRAAVFGALALLIGSVVFLAAVFPRGRSIKRARVIVWAGWISVAVSTVVGIGLEGLYASALPLTKFFDPSVWSDTLDTRYGRVALLRLVLLVIAYPLIRRLLRGGEARPPAWWIGLASLVGIGLSLTPALAGHASSGRWIPVAIPADTIHVGAMACWLGGLVVVFAVVMPRKDPDEMRAVLVRFSGLALACVVALVVTGAFQGYRQIGSINALKDTDYGRILIVKLIVFAGLIVAAAFSREVINRQFRTYDDEDDERAGSDVHDDVVERSHAEPVVVGAGSGPRRFFGGGWSLPDAADDRPVGDDDDEYEPPDLDSDVRRLRRSLLVEIVIATLVLAVTAVLVNAAPALTVTNEPVSLALRNSKVWVDVTLAPGNAGGNDIHVTALPVGGGLTTIQDLQMQLVKTDADLPPFDVPLQKLGEGHYYAPLFDIPYPGEWQMTVRVRLTETEETVVTGKFSLR